MVKRWLGDSPFAAFGASNALDEGGVEEVKETLAQAARVESESRNCPICEQSWFLTFFILHPTPPAEAADMEVEFNSVESDIIRAALFEMNENPLVSFSFRYHILLLSGFSLTFEVYRRPLPTTYLLRTTTLIPLGLTSPTSSVICCRSKG